MKRTTGIAALLLAAAMLSSCAPQTPGGKNKEPETSGTTAKTTKAPSVSVMGQVICDELFHITEKNAEITVFRCGDRYYTEPWDKDDPLNWWLCVEGTIPAELEAMPDGGFGVLKADITRLSGGIAGYFGQPQIDKVKSFRSLTTDEAAEKCGLTRYSTDETLYNEPQLCTVGDRTYIVIKTGKIHVYTDGQAFGVYDTSYEAEAAMGLYDIPDTTAEFRQVTGMPMYLFRCDGAYFAYSNYVSTDGSWSFLLDKDMVNKGMGFTLEDGEAAYIDRTDFMVVNGGEEGYCNAFMLCEDKEPQKIIYGTLTLKTSPEHWEEDPQVQLQHMYQYSAGDTIVFRFGSRYYVYTDRGGEIRRIGIFGSVGEVDEALGRDREKTSATADTLCPQNGQSINTEL